MDHSPSTCLGLSCDSQGRCLHSSPAWWGMSSRLKGSYNWYVLLQEVWGVGTTGHLHSLRMGDSGRKGFPKLAPELGKETRGQLSKA